MKFRILPILLALLLLASCKPKEEEIRIGTEDGGGTGYGVTVESILKLEDFYTVSKSSSRDNNRKMLGSPQYVSGGNDSYILSDGSRVILTYDSAGNLADSTYTESDASKSYSLFDKLALLGVIRNASSGSSTVEGGSQSSGGNTGEAEKLPMFSSSTYKKSAFDEGLSLYLERNTVLTTFGSPNYFLGRTYKKDSYIVDCYSLEDGSVLMLDYGYDRKSLRCAARRTSDGITEEYLGNWTVQTKPAELKRNTVKLNQVTVLSVGTSPQKVYEKLGEPHWFEGNAGNYTDAFELSDGSIIYLTYEGKHSKLASAGQYTADGKLLSVNLK